MKTTHYEVTVRGRLSPALTDAFEGLSAAPSAATTVIRGAIDQAALYRVLEQIDALGLELLDVRPSPSSH